MIKHTLTIGICLVYCLGLMAQLPQTEIYAFNISEGKKKKWKVYNPKLLTYDNKYGYNNQPSFIGHELYITQSSNFQGNDQTDIVALDIKNKIKTKVTRTAASEYSPTAHPDGTHFTVIKAHPDGTQHLMKYRLDRSDDGKVLFPKLKNVGYHCWLTDTKVALFLVDESKGHKIVMGDITSGSTSHVAFNVGRCMKRSPNGNLIYLDKEKEDSWRLKTLKPMTGQTILMGEMLNGIEDFEVLSDGYIVAGFEGSIYKFIPEKGAVWESIANLKSFIKNKKISRIAIKGSLMAVVVE